MTIARSDDRRRTTHRSTAAMSSRWKWRQRHTFLSTQSTSDTMRTYSAADRRASSGPRGGKITSPQSRSNCSVLYGDAGLHRIRRTI